MSGPIIRQGVIQLGVEIKTQTLSAGPVAAAIAAQQKAVAAATHETAGAAEAAAGSLEAQAAAEAKVQEIQERAIESAKIITQWKRYEEKQAKALAAAVEAEAQSKALASAGDVEAAEKAQLLARAHLKVADSYQKAALGALQMVRGVALLTGSESESLAVAAKQIFFVQGLIDVSKGAIAVSKALAAAHQAQAAAATLAGGATGRLAIVTGAFTALVSPELLALAAVVYIVVKAYEHFAGAAERAEQMAQSQRETYAQLAAAQDAVNERTAIGTAAEFDRIDVLNTLAQKEEALNAILAQRGDADKTAEADAKYSELFKTSAEVRTATLEEAIGLYERQRTAAEGLLAVNKEQADKAKGEIADRIELIKLRDRELDKAKEGVKAEEDKSRSLRASLGLLSGGEQRKLQRALGAVEGGDVSRKNLLTIQQSGGAEGQRLVEHLAAPLGKALGDAVERVTTKVTGEDPRSLAEAERRRREVALSQETGGKSASSAIAELEAQSDAITNKATDVMEQLNDVLTGLSHRLESLEKEQSRQRQSARNSSSRGRGR